MWHSLDLAIDPIRPGLLRRSPGPEVGGGLRGPDAKNQGYNQLIEMKCCMSHYSHKNMPDAKFVSGSFSQFWKYDATKFSSEEEN